MSIIKIPLINTYIKIEIQQFPKIEKLKKELSDFFDKNEIEGIKIKKFDLGFQGRGDTLKTIDIYPELNGMKLGSDVRENYSERIKSIGQRYCVDNLQFALSCYGK